MAEKTRIKISPVVAGFVQPGVSAETRLAGCAAAAGLPPFERITLLFCLSKDTDSLVRTAAIEQLELLTEDVINTYADSVDAHPSVLEVLSRISCVQPGQSVDDECDDECDELPVVEDEQFLSKYKMAQVMGIGEKIKMALSGDKEWRSVLVKDSNKLVSGSVIKNPRITESEVLALVKAGIQNDEIMRLICENKEWIKNYTIRKALITNTRTPVQKAMRYLDTMTEKDLASFAKSKNISSVISTLAKRLLLNKKR